MEDQKLGKWMICLAVAGVFGLGGAAAIAGVAGASSVVRHGDSASATSTSVETPVVQAQIQTQEFEWS
jgi:hypothetical protein